MPYTLAQLEAFVSSDVYDPATAAAIALSIPALKSADGELISPGVRRIRGNLCNVHGRYGPCDKALSGKKKPGKGRAKKPTKPKVDRAADQAKKRAATLTAQGYSADDQAALSALRSGAQPAKVSAALLDKGLVEQASDGSYRMTASGRALLGAADQGDAGRARDTASGAADRLAARRGRQAEQAKRQQDAAGKRQSAAMGRELAKRERLAKQQARAAAQAAKKPANASAGGSKKPANASAGGSKKPEKAPTEKPLRVKPTKRVARSRAPSVGGVAGAAANKKPVAQPKPKPEKPKAPPKQIAPALQTAADQLSQGADVSEADQLALIRNGLARLNKDGQLILTAAGMRATQKAARNPSDTCRHSRAEGALLPANPSHMPIIAPSFRVFKDATGRYRWVAQSSTAFQDRDKEIVSTKALAEDCDHADSTGIYGPLRWWHSPGLDLGDCDFNAMHGRVLIESGTFRSAAIAMKVAAAAPQLEISLGFLHLPTEPDANGVFHHIRRFERSLVPRGKASNRFTAFTVKEQSTMFDEKKIAGLKAVGFTDDDIAAIQAQAAATEKAATDQGVAYKADEPVEQVDLPDIIVNGVTYKAFPAPKTEAAAVEEAVVEEDAMDDMPMEEEPAQEGGLTLSPEDLAAIGEAIGAQLQGIAAQIMGALDLEKKVAGHVQGLMAPFQATKDAEQAATKEQIAALQQQLAELTGDQPAAAPYRPSAAKNNVLTDAAVLAAVKNTDPGADPWADIKQGLGLARPQ